MLRVVSWSATIFLSHTAGWSSTTLQSNLQAPSKLNRDFCTIFWSQKVFFLGRDCLFRPKSYVSSPLSTNRGDTLGGKGVWRDKPWGKSSATSSSSTELVETLQMVQCKCPWGCVSHLCTVNRGQHLPSVPPHPSSVKRGNLAHMPLSKQGFNLHLWQCNTNPCPWSAFQIPNPRHGNPALLIPAGLSPLCLLWGTFSSPLCGCKSLQIR